MFSGALGLGILRIWKHDLNEPPPLSPPSFSHTSSSGMAQVTRCTLFRVASHKELVILCSLCLLSVVITILICGSYPQPSLVPRLRGGRGKGEPGINCVRMRLIMTSHTTCPSWARSYLRHLCTFMRHATSSLLAPRSR